MLSRGPGGAPPGCLFEGSVANFWKCEYFGLEGGFVNFFDKLMGMWGRWSNPGRRSGTVDGGMAQWRAFSTLVQKNMLV